MYRGYRVRFTHRKTLIDRRLPLRIEMAILIQCQMRRFLGNKVVKHHRKTYHASALFVQRFYRGYRVRRWLRRDKAARVLQRASKTFKDRQFFNTVMMLVQLRKLFQRRDEAIVILQKVMRGCLTRIRIKRYRKKILMKFHKAARIMQMAFRALKQFRERQRRLAVRKISVFYCRDFYCTSEEIG